MIILFIENAQAKWAWEAEHEKKHNKKVDKTVRASEHHKEHCPSTMFSTKKSGSEKCGGWSGDGRKRFRKLRKLIQQGRNKDTTVRIEENLRRHLILKHKPTVPRKKVVDKKTHAIDLVDAVVDWQDDDGVVVEEEAYNSDDEAKGFAIDLPEEAESQGLESENEDGHDHNKSK